MSIKSKLVGAIHRNFWQRLPREQRRAMLFRGSALVAPRPDRGLRPSLPLIFAGPLTTASGLGETSRLSYISAHSLGIPTFGVDLTRTLMQEPDIDDFHFQDASALDGPGTVILNANSPLVPLTLLRLGKTFLRNKYIVGYWAWELPRVPDDWSIGMKFVHEIWAPSRFTADAIRPLSGSVPVRFMPYPALGATPPAVSVQRQNERPFTVLTIFNTASSFARKNPLAAIAAFRNAFGDDPGTRLIVKTSNAGAYPPAMPMLREAAGGASNIEIRDGSLPAKAFAALFDEADVILSLHRAEGFGLIPAEAMIRGLPVISTDFSSTTDFVSPDVGIPVPYTLVPARDPQGTYEYPGMVWAEPDIEAASAALRKLRADPAYCRRLGAAGRSFALTEWSGERFVRRALETLGL